MVQRNQHDSQQVHHRDVHQVEALAHREPNQRGSDGGADRPRVADPARVCSRREDPLHGMRAVGVGERP